jgi:hypothetical protein
MHLVCAVDVVLQAGKMDIIIHLCMHALPSMTITAGSRIADMDQRYRDRHGGLDAGHG